MKYKKVKTIEDNEILKLANDYQIARLVGCTPAYINHLRKGRRVATEAFYDNMVEKLAHLK